MTEVFLSTLQQVLVMLFFIAAGYVMERKKALPSDAAKTLSSLLTHFILPAYVAYNLSSSITLQCLSSYAIYLLAGLVCLALFVGIAWLLSVLFGRLFSERRLLLYIFAFSNYSYFGYPLIEAVYGAEMLASVLVFVIPFTIFIYTAGVYMIAPKHARVVRGRDGRPAMETKKTRHSLHIQPVIPALIFGIAMGLAGVDLTGGSNVFVLAAFGKILLAAKNCMSPLSMLLTGLVLARYTLKELFSSWKRAVLALVRLVLIPGIVLGMCMLLRLVTGLNGPEYLLIPVIIAAMPVGMNIVIFREEDGEESAQVVFLSLLFSVATVPLLFMLLAYLG